MTHVLVTGATGFVGRSLVARLSQESRFTVRAALRRDGAELPAGVDSVVVGDVCGTTDWSAALQCVDVVVHLAARVHVIHETAADPLAEFRRVNLYGAKTLALQAACAGVARLVFLSSIKVNGESGQYSEADAPAPQDLYGVSKWEAEQALQELAAKSELEVVIVRPPLVYGPGVRGNFESLMRAVASGIPMPLGAIHNRRSLIAVDNLVDFIVTCMDHSHAANETFLVSDGEDLSTSELVRTLARAMGRPARFVPIAPRVMATAAKLLRRDDVATRLFGSLQLDISKARTRLGWTPPIGLEEGIRRAAAGFCQACLSR